MYDATVSVGCKSSPLQQPCFMGSTSKYWIAKTGKLFSLKNYDTMPEKTAINTTEQPHHTKNMKRTAF